MTTFIEALVGRLRDACIYTKDDQVAPAALLWPDEERQWEPLIAVLRQHLPILTLGTYDPVRRIGPSYWIRCMVDRTLDDAIPETEVAVIYLPGISKQDIRAIEEADQLLKPLAELQFRGTLFTQKNGKDWTIPAFIQSTDGGLGIETGADNATKAAILGARSILADLSVEEMRRSAPLRAGFFNDKLQPDVVKNLLSWLNDPVKYRESVNDEVWEAFRAQCRSTYRLDPQTDGPVSMAAELGLGQSDAWELAWQRFAESPHAYPGLPERLRAARPRPKRNESAGLWTKRGRWPQENEEAESALRDALKAIADETPVEARERLLELEAQHAERRSWVWAQLGHAPLAHALSELARLAAGTAIPLTATTTVGIAEQYVDFGWKTDDAALKALSLVEKQADVSIVRGAERAVYRSWLEQSAVSFQKAVGLADEQSYPEKELPAWPAGTCVAFCDGLRLDLAHRMADELGLNGVGADVAWRLTALPSITSTAKYSVAPVAELFGGSASLDPAVVATGSSLNVGVLRSQLEGNGYQVLQGDDVGDPTGRAWTELTNIDQIGHKESAKLPRIAGETMREAAERIASLLEAGWQQVVVVTDHGWLFLPGELPKAELPLSLADQNLRKGRCARLKPGVHTDLMTVPWHWDAEVQVAMAPGICCFQAGKTYEHGGISPQECVTPVVTVSAKAGTGTAPVTLSVRWRNLRCDFETVGAPLGARVDIRTKAGDASSSVLTEPRALKTDGSATAPVEDDSMLGHAAFAVLVSEDGVVLAQVTTTVGGDG